MICNYIIRRGAWKDKLAYWYKTYSPVGKHLFRIACVKSIVFESMVVFCYAMNMYMRL